MRSGSRRTLILAILALVALGCDSPGIEIESHDGTTDPDTSTTGPIVLRWSWTIEGHSPDDVDYEALCSWAGGAEGTVVRLLVDADFDTLEDFYYDAQCVWERAETDPEHDPAGYRRGQTIWFAFELIDSRGMVLATSREWAEITLSRGTNDLGHVDFDLGDYGPLDILVQWADDTVDPAFGECSFPDPDVAIMGYLLMYATGEVVDEVDIDVDPMDCTTELSWLETAFDTYDLIVDGEDAAGSALWGSTCMGIVVDSEARNAWECDVLMTFSP